jgi:hypothetical protein
MANTHYDLGPLVNNTWNQWCQLSGQIYYEEIATGETSYTIPAGWEDGVGVSYLKILILQYTSNVY